MVVSYIIRRLVCISIKFLKNIGRALAHLTSAGANQIAKADPVGPPPALTKAEHFCDICMEYKPTSECLTVQGCKHAYCTPCVCEYVAAMVAANAGRIECPDSLCSAGQLEPDSCRGILPEKVLDKWGLQLCEQSIGLAERFYCPWKDCSALLILDDGPCEVVQTECPHCQRPVCARCRAPWHADNTCLQYERLAMEGNEVLRLAVLNKWTRCPACGVLIEKIMGCDYILCRCTTSFCYKCAGPIDEKTHLCDKCEEEFML